MRELYEVGFFFLKEDGESDAVVYLIHAETEDKAIQYGSLRFQVFNPTSKIILSHAHKLSWEYYAVTIWFDDENGKGQVWFQFIEEATELKALLSAKQIFYKQHDIRKITLVKEHVSPFLN